MKIAPEYGSVRTNRATFVGCSASVIVAFLKSTWAYVGVSQPLQKLAPIQLPLRDEHGVELYYNVAITPWYQITPDI